MVKIAAGAVTACMQFQRNALLLPNPVVEGFDVFGRDRPELRLRQLKGAQMWRKLRLSRPKVDNISFLDEAVRRPIA